MMPQEDPTSSEKLNRNCMTLVVSDSFKSQSSRPGVGTHTTLIPAFWEAEIGRSLRVQGQSGLHSEFQHSQGYRVTASLKGGEG